MLTKDSKFYRVSDRILIPILILLFGLGLYAYFLPGDLLGLDTHSHIGRTWLFKDILFEEGSFPIWTNRWYFGYPIGLYYGFLYYFLSAMTSLLTFGNVVMGTKVFLWAVHVCSGIGMFYFLRYLTVSGSAALFGALFYVFSYQHIGTIIKGGRLPLSLIYLFLPLIFYCLERFERSKTAISKAAPATAFLLSLALFTHLQYGVYCLLAFGIVGLSRLVWKFLYERDFPECKRTLAFLTLTGIFYSVFTAWILFPMLQDSSELVLSSSNNANMLLGKFSAEKSQNILKQILWTNNKNHENTYYLGLFPLSIAIFSWKQKRYSAAFISYLIMLAIGLVLTLRSPRFINIWFFFACIFSAYGVAGLNALLESRLRLATLYLAPILMALLLLDLGPTLLRKPYRQFDNSKIIEIQNLMKQEENQGRILVLNKTRSTLWRSLDVVNSGASSPFGGIPQASTKTHAFAGAIASKGAMEVFDQDSTLSESTLDALGLLNIKYVWMPKKKKLVRVPNASPVWFGQRFEVYKGKEARLEKETWASIRNKFERRALDYPYIENIVAEMQLDNETHTLGKVIAHDHIPINPIINSPLSVEKPFVLVSFIEKHQEVNMHFKSRSNGFVLLPYSFFSHNKVKIDGASVEAYKSVMNFTIVPVPQGEHTLAIVAAISPTRKVLLGIALIGLLIAVALFIKPKTRISR